jgi:trk system potassium uptake protein TrkH
MSGFTTTGATIMADVELLPNGILFWRSLTQWIGGIGIIFISLSILPLVKAINVQLSISDFSGQPADRIRPRIKDAAKRLIIIYVIITFTEALLLMAGGMNVLDAVCHSFSTVSTGGFSTKNGGISAFQSPFIRIVITVFMFVAGTNLTIFYFVIKRNLQRLVTNSEFITYSLVCSVAIIAVGTVLFINQEIPLGKAIMDSTFHVISVITTTGYYTENYNLWNNILVFIFFLLMFTGGTSGSSSGNIKMVRVLLLVKTSRQEMKWTIHPNAYVPVRLDGKIIPQTIVYNVIVFLILWFIIVCAGAIVVSLMGYDFITSFSTAAAMLANIGPGLGEFGAFSNYSAVPSAGKWLMSALMLLGRLELIAVLVLFTRKFYKK